jgi:hypothetical protein
MQKVALTDIKSILNNKKLTSIVVFVIITLMALVIILLIQRPERSVASYCKVYNEEKTRLSKLPGDTWPSAVFNDELSDANAFAEAFGKLEKVAPEEIRPDVKTLQSLYKKVADDPSQAIGVSLSGIGPEDSVKKWTVEHCK